MTFQVVKVSGDAEEWKMVDDIVTMEGALMFAEIAALEHSSRIDVAYNECSHGFVLITNNGTRVRYLVRSY
jgi:hypothetical protein